MKKFLLKKTTLIMVLTFVFTLTSSAEWYISPSFSKVNSTITETSKTSSSVWDLSFLKNRTSVNYFNSNPVSDQTNTANYSLNLVDNNFNFTDSECLPLSMNLKLYDMNTLVSDLQNYLHTFKYLNAMSTGYFGFKTFAAVKLFQNKNNISTSGVVDLNTRLKIAQLTCADDADAFKIVNGNTTLETGSTNANNVPVSNTNTNPVSNTNQTSNTNSVSNVEACAHFHSGHFAMADGKNAAASTGELGSYVNNQFFNDHFAGVSLIKFWNQLEGNAGDYTQAYTVIDDALNQLRPHNKALMLEVADRAFNAGNCSTKNPAPNGVRAVGQNRGENNCYAAIWETAVMDRQIALFKAIANRYQNEPLFAGIIISETVMGPNDPTYSDALLYSQLSRALNEYKDVKVPIIIQVNYAPNQELLNSLTTPLLAIKGGGGFGWPDTSYLFNNSIEYSTASNNSQKLWIVPQFQNGGFPDETAYQDRFIYARDTLHAQSMIWGNGGPSGYGVAHLTGDIAPAIWNNSYSNPGEFKNLACPFIKSSTASNVSTSPSASSNTNTNTNSSNSAGSCSKFSPGHYIFVADNDLLGWDGFTFIKRISDTKDLSNFAGFFYNINWGMIEKNQGEYDMSRLKAILDYADSKGKKIRFRLMDRTHHTSCDTTFAPLYLARDTADPKFNNPNWCTTRIWESSTMDRYIAVNKKILETFKDHPAFIGLGFEETSIGSVNTDYNALYTQLKRLVTELHSVAPDVSLTIFMNWPRNGKSDFDNLAQHLVSLGGGGSMGWPDSIPSNAYDSSWNWYQVARENKSKLLIAPDVESTFLNGSLAETEQVYQMLVNDIGAHEINWDVWQSTYGEGYLDNVIQTVNAHGGAINNTCPFQ